MDSFLQSFIAVLIASMGDAPQLMAAILAMRFAGTRAVLGGVVLACTLNVIISAGGGGAMHNAVDGPFFALLQLVAFAGAGLSMIILRPKLRVPKQESAGTLFTVFVTVAALQLLDKSQFLIAAFSARTGQPLVIGAAGLLALLVAIVPAVVLRERLGAILPLPLIRRIGGAAFLIVAVSLGFRLFRLT